MKIMTASEIRNAAVNLAPLESQKEYRRRLSEFIRMHNARVAALDNGINPGALPGNSMLILAQTGSGKSYTAARLAEAAGVTVINIDCSSLTRAGYKGCNLGDLIHSAKQSIKDDLCFERAILFFDEVDKLYLDGTEGNPQVNFLKLFDGIIQADPRGNGPTTIDVSRMSFLFAGAFAGLSDIISARLKPRSIGFSAERDTTREVDDLLSLATMEDIRRFGFMEELLGRMGSICYIPPLTAADYRTLLKGNEGSVCRKYNNLLSPSGVTLDITDSACAYIAAEAGKSALGARAVDPIVYEKLQHAFSRIDSDDSINHISLSCRNNHLTLRYSHGSRNTVEVTPPKKAVTMPDVSIAGYLSSEDGIAELRELAMEMFQRKDDIERLLLRTFLDCTLTFMGTLKNEDDKNLSSLSKIANSTKLDSGKDRSVYGRMITEAIRRVKDPEVKEHLEVSFSAFQAMEDETTYEFLTSATKQLRQGWYQNLMDAAACA